MVGHKDDIATLDLRGSPAFGETELKLIPEGGVEWMERFGVMCQDEVQ